MLVKGSRNIVIGVLGLLILLFLSEFLFIWKQKPHIVKEVRVKYHLLNIRRGLEYNDWERVARHLEEFTKMRMIDVANAHVDVEIITDVDIPIAGIRDGLVDLYIENLEEWDWGLLEKSYGTNLAGHYYDLGLIAWENDAPELTEDFLDIARRLAPDWSYFYVELANFYWINGDEDLAVATLAKCRELKSPRFHCEDFLLTVQHVESNEEVGFLREDIQRQNNTLY